MAPTALQTGARVWFAGATDILDVIVYCEIWCVFPQPRHWKGAKLSDLDKCQFTSFGEQVTHTTLMCPDVCDL